MQLPVATKLNATKTRSKVNCILYPFSLAFQSCFVPSKETNIKSRQETNCAVFQSEGPAILIRMTQSLSKKTHYGPEGFLFSFLNVSEQSVSKAGDANLKILVRAQSLKSEMHFCRECMTFQYKWLTFVSGI